MLIQNHPLAGHGDAGEVAALVAAGLSDEKDLRPAYTTGEVVSELLLADRNGAVYFVVRRCIPPGVESIFALIAGKAREESGNGISHTYLLMGSNR